MTSILSHQGQTRRVERWKGHRMDRAYMTAVMISEGALEAACSSRLSYMGATNKRWHQVRHERERGTWSRLITPASRRRYG